jgi:tetrahydromethanopterin S-methyltransferase subunit D
MLETVWTILNSPAGITAMVTLVIFIINKIYAAKPIWRQYEGLFTQAVKMAEKAIPDDSPNKSVRRLDEALKYINRVLAAYNIKATGAEVLNGIEIIHAEQEQTGNLTS